MVKVVAKLSANFIIGMFDAKGLPIKNSGCNKLFLCGWIANTNFVRKKGFRLLIILKISVSLLHAYSATP